MSWFEISPEQRWLFFFAHPDDELAVACSIQRLVLSGVPVHLRWAHQTPVRQKESEAFVAELGGVANCEFGSFTDGQMVKKLNHLVKWACSQCEAVAPTHVVTLAYEQGHLDHDAVHFAVRQVWDQPLAEFPMYHHYARTWQRIGEFANPRETDEMILLTPEERAWKQHVLNCFPSQTVRRNVRWYQQLTKWLGAPRDLFAQERLRTARVQSYLDPVHDEVTSLRIRRSRRWHRWTQAVEEFGRLSP